MDMPKVRFKEVHDCQKSYAIKRREDLEFQIDNQLQLKFRNFEGWSKIRKLKILNRSIRDHILLWSGVERLVTDWIYQERYQTSKTCSILLFWRKSWESQSLYCSSRQVTLERMYATYQPVKIIDRQVKAFQGMPTVFVRVRWKRVGIQ